jgi:hypothetical protein
MLLFIKMNLRWLTAGFVLTFASAFGQTWFISLFAGAIKAEHGLTDGGWGSLYTAATLCSAGLLFWRGSAADTVRLSRLAPSWHLCLRFLVSAWPWRSPFGFWASRCSFSGFAVKECSAILR